MFNLLLISFFSFPFIYLFDSYCHSIDPAKMCTNRHYLGSYCELLTVAGLTHKSWRRASARDKVMSFFWAVPIDYLCHNRSYKLAKRKTLHPFLRYLFPLHLFTERRQRGPLIIFSIIKSLWFILSISQSLSVFRWFQSLKQGRLTDCMRNWPFLKNLLNYPDLTIKAYFSEGQLPIFSMVS